jgi:hypothetical protein
MARSGNVDVVAGERRGGQAISIERDILEDLAVHIPIHPAALD